MRSGTILREKWDIIFFNRRGKIVKFLTLLHTFPSNVFGLQMQIFTCLSQNIDLLTRLICKSTLSHFSFRHVPLLPGVSHISLKYMHKKNMQTLPNYKTYMGIAMIARCPEGFLTYRDKAWSPSAKVFRWLDFC